MTKQKPFANTRSFLNGLLEALADSTVRMLLALTFSMILLAALIYTQLEGWGLVDSIYFATVTIATVGYGDFSPQTTAGKLFTVGYIVVGIGLFVAMASALADHLIRRARRDLEATDQETSAGDPPDSP